MTAPAVLAKWCAAKAARHLVLALTLLLSCLAFGPGNADARVSSSAAAALGPGDLLQLGQLADSRLREGRKAGKLGPAVIAIVQDGRIIFGKTYGDERPGGKRVDFASTQFQVASITKVFTATAIMQLVARGDIASIHDPANRYLKRIKLRPNRGHEITIAELMTHRAGFEDSLFGFNTRHEVRRPLKASQILPYMPTYVRPAGGYIDYSNVSTSLLGLIVEDVSGMNFDSYLKSRIFDPLGMTHTLLHEQPGRPARLVQSLAFDPDNPKGKPIRYDPGYPFLAPSGAMLSTGADMARYIDAAARTAADDDSAILPAGVQSSMFDTLASSHPAMIGIGRSWFTYRRNGVRLVEHGGDLAGAHSMLTLIPSMRAGIFISIASESAMPADNPFRFSARQLNNEFVDVLFGEQREFPATSKEAVINAAEICGKYLFERRSHTRATLPASPLTVSCAGGKITLEGFGELRPIGPGLYKGPKKLVFDYVAFERGSDGRVTLVPYFPFTVAKKIEWYADPGLAILLALGGFGIIAVGGLVCLFFRDPDRTARRAKWTPALIALLLGAMLAAVTIPVDGEQPLVGDYLFGERLGFGSLAVLANLSVLLSLWLLVAAVLAWRRQWWAGKRRWAARTRRTIFTLVALAGLFLIPLFVHMNLLGWNVQ